MPPIIKISRKIKTNCRGFPDDSALLATYIDKAKTQMLELENILCNIGLKISSEKTQFLPLKPIILRKVNLNGNKFKIVIQFKYLGEIITHNTSEKSSIQTRTNNLAKAQKLSWYTNSKKYLSIKA